MRVWRTSPSPSQSLSPSKAALRAKNEQEEVQATIEEIREHRGGFPVRLGSRDKQNATALMEKLLDVGAYGVTSLLTSPVT